jgi:outer membrane immunogenic protein
VSGGFGPFAPATTAFGASKTNTGFAVGGGAEGKLYWLPTNWTWKLEYLYVDLGSLDVATSFPPAIPIALFGTTTAFAGPLTAHTHFTDNIVRVGLKCQFH